MSDPLDKRSFMALVDEGDLDGALKLAGEAEAEIRHLFARDRKSRSLDPHIGLVDVFKEPPEKWKTRERVINNSDDLSASYILPLNEMMRRKEGTLSTVERIKDFERNWTIFTQDMLKHLDWDNVVAAGGSVLACLAPVPKYVKAESDLRSYFHKTRYPTSDVDLFLWGMTAQEVWRLHDVYSF